MPPGFTNKCDKCGQPPAKDNDDVQLAYHITGSPFAFLADHHRHVLPVTADDGTVLCPGSPRVAQYLPDQPRSTDPADEWDEEFGQLVREAYAKMADAND